MIVKQKVAPKTLICQRPVLHCVHSPYSTFDVFTHLPTAHDFVRQIVLSQKPGKDLIYPDKPSTTVVLLSRKHFTSRQRIGGSLQLQLSLPCLRDSAELSCSPLLYDDRQAQCGTSTHPIIIYLGRNWVVPVFIGTLFQRWVGWGV